MAKSVVCDLVSIFKNSVSAVLPENLIRRSVKYSRSSQQLTIVGENFNLQNKNVYLVGTGKAVQNMVTEIESILNSKIKHGIISIPVGSLKASSRNKNITYNEGAKNNLPDTNAETTAKQIEELATKLESNDFLLILISGGGSALLPLPKAPITLDEKTTLVKKLANSGADIQELNTVRKRVSDLKGGQLAIKAQPAQVVSLVLSDIVEDPLDLIASGPTTENKDDPHKAIDIIQKYNLFNELPQSIRSVLTKNDTKVEFPEHNVWNFIIGSNKISIAAAMEEAKNLNYLALNLSSAVTGNVKEIASKYVAITKLLCSYLKEELNLEDMRKKIDDCNIPGLNAEVYKNLTRTQNICLILGGEITVQVKGSGKGGRNQQLALEFSNYIHNLKNELDNINVYFLSAGTDGIDGPTDAAGAIGHLNLVSDANKDNIDILKYLNENDSYNFYKQFRNGDYHVITGHTNTNVMDIHIIIIKRTE